MKKNRIPTLYNSLHYIYFLFIKIKKACLKYIPAGCNIAKK